MILRFCWPQALRRGRRACAWARRASNITPAADPANPPSGKYAHEKLFVRAIVLDNGTTRAALIGADQSLLFENIWAAASKQVAAELNCPVEHRPFGDSHA